MAVLGDGAFDTEDGEFALRQDVSPDIATVLMSELPPVRPFESVMANITEVPAATSAIHSNEVGPTLG